MEIVHLDMQLEPMLIISSISMFVLAKNIVGNNGFFLPAQVLHVRAPRPTQDISVVDAAKPRLKSLVTLGHRGHQQKFPPLWWIVLLEIGPLCQTQIARIQSALKANGSVMFLWVGVLLLVKTRGK